jgi:TPR repeat protein
MLQQAAMDQVGEAEVNVGTFHFGLLYAHPLAQHSEQIAVYWWLRAASRGQRKAQLNLGSAFYTGKGITENRTHAILWWRRGQ